MASLNFAGDFTVPEDPRLPVTFKLEEHALRLAVVNRTDLGLLNANEWNKPGVYVLIGASQKKPSKTEVYVGKSSQKKGVRGRVLTQNTNPKGAADFDWLKAAVFVRHTLDGFNSAQVGYLEGRLAAKLKKSPALDVQAGKSDEDDSLTSAQLASMDALVPSLLAGLRLAGLDITPSPDTAEPDEVAPDNTANVKKQRFSVTIAQLVEVGLLAAGDVLVFERKGKKQTCAVTGDGYLVVDGTEYSAPSAAAVAAYPGEIEAAPGWDVWRLEDGAKTIGDLRDEFIAMEKTDA